MSYFQDALRAKLHDISVEFAALESKRGRLENLRAHIERALELDGSEDDENPNVINAAGKSVNRNLIELARRNNGILETREAIDPLVKAGIYGSREEANDGIHSTLRRSKDFIRIDRGIYRYVKRSQGLHGLGIADLVEEYLRDDPTLTYEEILEKALSQGFDFGDKQPTQAIHMAAIHARRRIEESSRRLGIIGLPHSIDDIISPLSEMPPQYRSLERRNDVDH